MGSIGELGGRRHSALVGLEKINTYAEITLSIMMVQEKDVKQERHDSEKEKRFIPQFDGLLEPEYLRIRQRGKSVKELIRENW